MRFIENKVRLCSCGCGLPCKVKYRGKRFKGYSLKSPDCPNKFKRTKPQETPDRRPVGSRRIENCDGISYYVIKTGKGRDNWMREHRFIAETQIRPLAPGEHVHHINGNSLDNRPENLAILLAGEHARTHHGLKGRWSIKHQACTCCHRTKFKHYAKGLCSSCYQKRWYSNKRSH
jgi:hypothetical protein